MDQDTPRSRPLAEAFQNELRGFFRRGLAIATVITLLLVPVFYSIAVKDLKIVKWESKAGHPAPGVA